MEELKKEQAEVKEEYQEELQETEIKTKKPLEIRNAQEIKDNFLSIEVKGLYSDDFCQYIFDPMAEQNEELVELLKTADIKSYVVDIETLKTAKHAELKSIMQAKRKALTCDYAADVFDCDELAQANMTSLMSFANLGMTEFYIRSTNERTHTFTAEQLVELATIMSKTVNALYSEYWQYKNALYECKTKEEIDKIEWKI